MGVAVYAALGFVQVETRAPELRLLHRWLDSWTGLGAISVVCTAKVGNSNSPSTAATFFATGQAHSIVGGSAWEATAWRAVHRAAWAALKGARIWRWRQHAVVLPSIVLRT